MLKAIAIAATVSLMLSGIANADGLLTSKAELHAAVIGNTVVGVENNEPYIEYFAEDGVIHGLGEDDEAYLGKWEIRGNKLCSRYDIRKPWECTEVSIHGDNLEWVDDESKSSAKLEIGNSRHF